MSIVLVFLILPAPLFTSMHSLMFIYTYVRSRYVARIGLIQYTNMTEF
jgi:hypothetical protein